MVKRRRTIALLAGLVAVFALSFAAGEGAGGDTPSERSFVAVPRIGVPRGAPAIRGLPGAPSVPQRLRQPEKKATTPDNGDHVTPPAPTPGPGGDVKPTPVPPPPPPPPPGPGPLPPQPVPK